MVTDASIAPQINYSAENLLATCESQLVSGDIVAAMETCKLFLANYPVIKTGVEKESVAYQNYIRLASSMLRNNHNYESVINLLQTKNNMLDFIDSFYLTRDKKGVHYPTPIVQKEDATFVYHFCVGFHKMISQKLD